jgi:hypothetical protein
VDRCETCASEVLAPTAREVLTPHAVVAVIPSVTDWLSLDEYEWLASLVSERVDPPNGIRLLSRLRPRAWLRPRVSLAAADVDSEPDVPTVLV